MEDLVEEILRPDALEDLSVDAVAGFGDAQPVDVLEDPGDEGAEPPCLIRVLGREAGVLPEQPEGVGQAPPKLEGNRQKVPPDLGPAVLQKGPEKIEIEGGVRGSSEKDFKLRGARLRADEARGVGPEETRRLAQNEPERVLGLRGGADRPSSSERKR